ncbi:hypothetical protein, partial [Listeria monocytogenes]|uniref:hypothetical protein n=1 Tax=Listeria monocytogenes TaxID=1639 RepID=UPI003FA435DB
MVRRLLSDIQSRDGVEKVHLDAGKDGEWPKLCIHYDSEKLPLIRIRELVEAAGSRISDRWGHF